MMMKLKMKRKTRIRKSMKRIKMKNEDKDENEEEDENEGIDEDEETDENEDTYHPIRPLTKLAARRDAGITGKIAKITSIAVEPVCPVTKASWASRTNVESFIITC